ncbi:uncharacterized protein [Drosophila kikkawai]|uniref:Accessory gland protein Acp29AB-like n=1 Tax=Drosophila kikkawai TaxID=30033 RepID=A0A6P4ISD1_DROKI|nr:uncharacterized protein LOC108076864 [Drosophila kikkawai]
MHNFVAFFLWALAACTLWVGSFAEDQSGYVCLIDDPNPKQCDNFCRTELLRMLNEDAGGSGTGNTCDAKIREKLDSVADQQAKLEGQLHGVEAKLEGQLEEVQTKLEDQQTKMEAKLQESLTVLNKLEDSQAKLEIQLQAIVNQLQAVSNKIDDATVEIPDLVWMAQLGFQRIGTRYFRIETETESWDTAKRRCRINDHGNEGYFVSVASQKPAPFLKWGKGEPSDRYHEWNCVNTHDGHMWDYNCNNEIYFICQADNET